MKKEKREKKSVRFTEREWRVIPNHKIGGKSEFIRRATKEKITKELDRK